MRCYAKGGCCPLLRKRPGWAAATCKRCQKVPKGKPYRGPRIVSALKTCLRDACPFAGPLGPPLSGSGGFSVAVGGIPHARSSINLTLVNNGPSPVFRRASCEFRVSSCGGRQPAQLGQRGRTSQASAQSLHVMACATLIPRISPSQGLDVCPPFARELHRHLGPHRDCKCRANRVPHLRSRSRAQHRLLIVDTVISAASTFPATSHASLEDIIQVKAREVQLCPRPLQQICPVQSFRSHKSLSTVRHYSL